MLIDELLTPALLLDIDILERNLSRMQGKVNALGSLLRPHIKTHKCIEIAKRQQELGANGITVSTLYEAEQFAKAGFHDMTWAFPLPPVYADSVVKLARSVTLRVVIDSREAFEVLESACRRTAAKVHVWLKVDCGYHRAGVDPATPLAEELVRALCGSPYLQFDGILSHSGHAYFGRNRSEILAAANQERDVMVNFSTRMKAQGYPVPSVSIGSTPSMSVIEHLDGIREVRPGNYCFYDHTMVSLGICEPDDCAVTVLASVISHQPGAGHFVIDAGALALSKDSGFSGQTAIPSMGVLFDDYPSKRLVNGTALRTLSQEHGKVVGDNPSTIEQKFRVGTKVRILENHSCLTVAHYDEYAVVRGNEVVDRWKILRGRT